MIQQCTSFVIMPGKKGKKKGGIVQKERGKREGSAQVPKLSSFTRLGDLEEKKIKKEGGKREKKGRAELELYIIPPLKG